MYVLILANGYTKGVRHIKDSQNKKSREQALEISKIISLKLGIPQTKHTHKYKFETQALIPNSQIFTSV